MDAQEVKPATIGHSDTPEKDCVSFKTPSDLTDLIPNFSDLHDIFVAAYKIPDDVLKELKAKIKDFQFKMPSFDFKFGDIDIPSMQDAYAALATYSGQLLMIIKKVVDSIKSLIPKFELPKIPELDLSLDDLFGDVGEIVDKLKKKFNDSIDGLSDFLKNIPPIFIGFGSTTLEFSTVLLSGIVKYIGIVIDFVMGKIKDVIDVLKDMFEDNVIKPITDLFDSIMKIIDAIPSFTEIMDKVKTKIKDLKDQTDNGTGIVDTIREKATGKVKEILDEAKGDARKIVDAFKSIHFPEFDFKIPDPLFPKMDIPFAEIVHSFNAMIAQMYATVIKKITDLVDKIMSLFGIEIKWPKISDWLKTQSIPTFCAKDAVEKVKKETELQKTLGINAQQSPVDNGPSIADNQNFSPIP